MRTDSIPTIRDRKSAAPGAVLALAWLLCSQVAAADDGPTAREAADFVAQAESRLLDLGIKSSRASWVQSNFITKDTELLAAEAQKNYLAAVMESAKGAARFDGLDLPADLSRKLGLLKTALTLAAPEEPAKQQELSEITAGMESRYSLGEYCPGGGECMDFEKLDRIMAESRDPRELLDAWRGWRTIAPPLRPMYARFVDLANEGARELGFSDLGALWRSGYDMDPQAFAAELDRLWGQVRPLYEALHCHVRAALSDQYGRDTVPRKGPIPAHLLGNMWSQSWLNVYDIVAPPGGDPGYELTRLLESRKVDALEMVRIGERFFTSLGFPPLPGTFWERSLFVKPPDRDVVCYASAWDIDAVDDVRIKMCIQVNEEDFTTIHHELGHVFYDLAYSRQSPLYRDGANDGFHEGIGDTLALSITPDYLVRIGFLDEAPGDDADLGLLMKMALDRVAFLPFGLLVDQWRWKVFSGEVPPERYNEAWWELRERYQGIAPPVARTEADFDPGAKYHIPGNTPYTRYFLASILQFQFHRALCEAAGYEGPLHRCSIYGNEEAGARLRSMLEMGSSRPWPEALEAMTGKRTMDATAIIDYFAPLMAWLEKANEGRTCGW